MKTQTFFRTSIAMAGALFGLIACNRATPTSLPSPAPTHPTAVATVAAQASEAPTAVPSAGPTVTQPPATNTLMPTSPPAATSLFHLSLELPVDLSQTSTPIAVPENTAQGFKLKAWHEVDAIKLIQLLDQYAEANDICFPAGCVRTNLVYAQDPVRLALQETSWRFPETQKTEQYRWRLALADAILGKNDSDAWLIGRLEAELNQTGLSPEMLNNFLAPYGFVIRSPYLWNEEPNVFPNLLGDQKDTLVYRLTTQWTQADGLFFAVYSDPQGKQKIAPIHSEWLFDNAQNEVRGFGDNNANGTPEITIFIGNQSGTMPECGYNLVFEWQGEQFGQIEANNIACEWEWGGSQNDELSGWLKSGQYAKAIEYLEKILLTQEQPMIDGANPDLLRFQLGLLYLFTSRNEEALTQWQTIANTPETSSAQATKAFLARYSGGFSLYPACAAAREICDPNLVFPYLVRMLNAEQAADVPAALRQAEVTVEYSERLDVDGDNDQDWIEVISVPSGTGETYVGLWVLVQEPTGLVALQANDERSIDFATAQQTFSVKRIAPAAENQLPGVLVRSGNKLFVFQVRNNEANGPQLQHAGDFWTEISDFSFEDGQDGIKLAVSYLATEYSAANTETYLWDAVDNQFKPEAEALEARAEHAGQLMLQEGKAAEAIPVFQAIVTSPPQACDPAYSSEEYCDQVLIQRSRYHYFLALAYELAGEEANAVQTYWQLWHDFPRSPYALMARAKLEAK